MPTVKLLLNLGRPDAQALDVDPAAATAGAELSVTQDAYDEIIRRGWGVDPDAGPTPTAAAPSSSVTPKVGEADKASTAGAAPDLSGMTKQDLLDYSAANGIDGVSMAQTKDEMIATIEDHLTR